MHSMHARGSWILFGLTLLGALIVIRPLAGAMLTAAVLSYVFYPVFKWLQGKTKRKSLAAFTVTIATLLLIILPSGFVLNTLSHEVYGGYITLRQHLREDGQEGCPLSAACVTGSIINYANLNVQERAFIENSLGKMTTAAVKKMSDTLISLPGIALNLFVVFFVMYYLLKDGRTMVNRIKTLLPFKKTHQEELLERFNDVTYAVVFGNIVVASVQGVLAAIGFYIAGVQSPLIWGIMTALVSIVPLVGPFIIWLPLSLMMVASGYVDGDIVMSVKGIGLMVYGLVVISGVDNILKPRIIGERAQVNPALILLGVIGGLAAFGLIGAILGPVLLALTETSLELVTREKKAIARKRDSRS